MNIFIYLWFENFNRTFRFIIDGSEATDAQQQTVSCILHLNPADDTVDSSQADDCDCYTQDECENSANQFINSPRYDPSADAVLVIGQPNNYDNRLDHTNKRMGIVTPDG